MFTIHSNSSPYSKHASKTHNTSGGSLESRELQLPKLQSRESSQ